MREKSPLSKKRGRGMNGRTVSQHPRKRGESHYFHRRISMTSATIVSACNRRLASEFVLLELNLWTSLTWFATDELCGFVVTIGNDLCSEQES